MLIMVENDVNRPINNDPMEKKETNLSITPHKYRYLRHFNHRLSLGTTKVDCYSMPKLRAIYNKALLKSIKYARQLSASEAVRY